MNYKKIHDTIIDNARSRTYDSKIHHKHHIIPIHEDQHSTETVPLTFKEHYVVHHLRWKFVGTLGNYLAYYNLKGLNKSDKNILEICSNAGKIGGRTTKDNRLGIFSEEWDRSAQSKLNWENGLLDHIDFTEIGKLGGSTTRANSSGIFRDDLQYMRPIWAKIGSEALAESGNRGGCVTKEWRDNNYDKVLENTSKGGSVGGKVTGKMYWWNNGKTNTKAFECPGDGWVRGMLMSEKKREQVMKIAGMNKKEKVSEV